MKQLRSYLCALLFAITVGGTTTALIGPASATSAACQDRVLTFPTWYRGFTCSGGNLTISGDPKTVVLTITLNFIEIILQLVAYASVAFIIYGGFVYITGAGAQDKIATGKNSVLNATVGLIISMLSVVIVNIIIGNLTKSGGSGAHGLSTASAGDILNGVLTTVYWAGGVTAVIVIIISGIMYATSEGDANKVQRAKNGILYSIVGLVLIIMAFTITHFVIGRIVS